MIFKNKKILIVAELSANHGKDLSIAIETIKAAKRSGADAVKLQTYKADTITIKSNSKDFLISNGSIWDGKYLYNLYEDACTPWEWHEELFKVAKNEGILCFSTPFDKSAVDFLEKLDNPIYKIASCEITDIPLIRYAASKGKPMIISTGIATLEDIELAVKSIRLEGNTEIAILKCTSSYPASLEEANLKMIEDLKERFNVTTGLSDHSLGIISPVVAVSLGAKIIEKHLILNDDVGGPDAAFSLNEIEFTEMVNAVRQAELAIGKVDYSLTDSQFKSKNFSRSLYVVKDIKKGEKINEDNVKSIRPGYGLHPKYSDKIMGKTAKRDLFKGERMDFNLIN